QPFSSNRLAQILTERRPDEAWAGEITYIWTLEGWVYLAVLLDLHSRRVVGWPMRKSLNRELVIAALNQAILLREPPRGLIHHTDRGSQYARSEERRVGQECT